MKSSLANRTLVVLALALLPAVLPAQRKARGADDEKAWNAMDKVGKTTLKLSNKDVQNASPMKLLIDKRKDLKLSDTQLQQFKDIEKKLDQQNESQFSAMDSLRNELKTSPRPEDDRARFIGARNGLTHVLAAIRLNYDESTKSAVCLLDEGQQKMAADLLKALATETEEMLKEKLGGR